MTQNPLLGGDALAPFTEAAEAHGTGLFVLVRTSNPGAADLFDLELAAGGPLWERIAALVAGAGTPGPESGLAAVGAVTGATAPAAPRAHARADAAHAVPAPRDRGAGRHRGRARAGVRARPGRRARQRVALDRRRPRGGGGAPAEAARAEAERLREQAWALV